MSDPKQLTNEEIKRRVRRIQRQFISDVNPDTLSDWLRAEQVLTVEHWQTISANNPTQNSRCRALLLDLFTNSNPKTFLVVLKALEDEAPHLLESIYSQSLHTSEDQSLQIPKLNVSNGRQEQDLEEKVEQLLCQQKNLEQLCSDLRKQLETEREKHLQEKERMEREWKTERNLSLQKQNQLEQRISELEHLLQLDKRKKSDEKQYDRSESLNKTVPAAEIETLQGIQASQQLQLPDTFSRVKQAKEFFSRQTNAERPSNERQQQTSPEARLNKSIWERKSDQPSTDIATTSNDRSEHRLLTVVKHRNEQNTDQQPTIKLETAPISPKPTVENATESVPYLTIRTKAAAEQNKAIIGLTILDKELFVVSRLSSEVEVFDSNELSFRRTWKLDELVAPLDIGSCSVNKCLYIMHENGSGQTSEVLRVDRNGALKNRWITGSDYGCSISVTGESNIIVIGFRESKLIEYSPEGCLIREVSLALEEGLVHPSYALKLANGSFLVSHGARNDRLHRVCMVGSDGKIKKTFSGKNGKITSGMNRPVYLAVDGSGLRLVVDQWNSRVLLLDSNLEFRREILSKEEHGLRRPLRIFVDEESNGRLFVVDNDWDSTKLISTDGRILVFNKNY